ncbi:hypothetical protein ACJQWK_02111 [Exserohilum turcicum]
MSLPVRSPSCAQTTSHHVESTTVLSAVDAIDQPHQINHSPPKTPENTANMSETKITPPISSLQCSSSRPTSPTSSTVPVQESNTATMQSDEDSADITVAKPSTQIQHAQAPQLDSMIAPTSNVEADHTTQSSKRSREEDSSSSAFGTPPPKRASKAKATANAKKATKKTAPPKKAAPKKSTPQKAATPAPSRSQPPRNRRAPDHLKDFQETTPPKPLPNKKSCSKVFDPVFITTNSNSRLVKADIYHMLLEGPAWTSLSAEQQSTLISMLPPDPANQALLTKINTGETEDTRPSAFTLANDCFRTDVAKFQEDLKNGHLAKTWQAAAEQAVIERTAGEFDKWKADEAESWWGQKSSVPTTQ